MPRPAAYCEIDEHATAVLRARMADDKLPTAPVCQDIATLNAEWLRENTGSDKQVRSFGQDRTCPHRRYVGGWVSTPVTARVVNGHRARASAPWVVVQGLNTSDRRYTPTSYDWWMSCNPCFSYSKMFHARRNFSTPCANGSRTHGNVKHFANAGSRTKV